MPGRRKINARYICDSEHRDLGGVCRQQEHLPLVKRRASRGCYSGGIRGETAHAARTGASSHATQLQEAESIFRSLALK